MDINIFQLAMEEQSGGGRGVVATVKRDWPKIWPPQLEGNRMYAFDCFAKFWGRASPADSMSQHGCVVFFDVWIVGGSVLGRSALKPCALRTGALEACG